MRTPTRPYCIGPASTVKCLMVQLDTPEPVASLTFDQPFTFHCTEMDTLNKVPLREKVVNLKAGTKLFFVASREVIGWYYIMMANQHGIGCSCKQERCEHQEMLREHTNAAAA